MSVRIYVINSTGDGLTLETAFRPNCIITTKSWQYKIGIRFIVASPDDLTAYGTEVTRADLIQLAATQYGVTPAMLGRNLDGSKIT